MLAELLTILQESLNCSEITHHASRFSGDTWVVEVRRLNRYVLVEFSESLQLFGIASDHNQGDGNEEIYGTAQEVCQRIHELIVGGRRSRPGFVSHAALDIAVRREHELPHEHPLMPEYREISKAYHRFR